MSGVDQSYVERVLTAVEAVPPGRVTSYGDLASLLGGGGPRRVAMVMSRYGAGVAWWRVVRTDGRPAPQIADRALRELAAEATPVREGRVDMGRARLSPSEWSRLRPDLATTG